MADEWKGRDPFADPGDPEAAAREQRRREREEKRRRRAESRPAEPAPEPTAPPSRTAAGRDFWDEEDGREGDVDLPLPGTDPEGGQGREWIPGQGRDRGTGHERDDLHPGDDLDRGGGGGGVPRAGYGSAAGGSGGGRGRSPLGALRRHPFLVAATLAALVVAWFLWSLFQPFHGGGSGRVVVIVPKGAGAAEVGDLLERKGVIDDSTFFQLRVTLAGKRSSLYAGRFELARGMSYGDAIDAIDRPPAKRTLTVTVPEGYSRAQAAPLVREDGIRGNYLKATVRSPYLDPADYGGKRAHNLEGFLFPNTFELRPNAPVGHLVQLQLADFKRKIKGVDMRYAKSKNLTVYDVLTIASMIEREAGVADQRRKVAAVIYNRLREGMTLGIDATIRFATGNYTKPLTESELAVDSPYNTRTNQGLPPGPINSPGLAAIEAAAHPSRDGYLFYVNKPNTCGELAFSKTEAEFEADVAAYERAREENGGNEPTSCGD